MPPRLELGLFYPNRTESPPKLHPCAFYSRKLSPAERNYDVGDRELLVVKKALNTWQHWLEGAKHPFLVWKDHKNLEYIRAAKRLNPRQARWALFFARVDFTLSYRLGSKNIKANALSRVHDTEDRREKVTPIIPLSCTVAPVVWNVDRDIRRALRQEPSPNHCPEGRIYMPSPPWAHTALLGHLGIAHTINWLFAKYWSPTLAWDVQV